MSDTFPFKSSAFVTYYYYACSVSPSLVKKEDIWLSSMTKAPTPTEKSKKQCDNKIKTPTKTSITQQLRTDLGRSVGVTIATQLVWYYTTLLKCLSRIYSPVYTTIFLYLFTLNHINISFSAYNIVNNAAEMTDI